MEAESQIYIERSKKVQKSRNDLWYTYWYMKLIGIKQMESLLSAWES